ncbi:hypothetical protein HaLaN_06048, partial [Haematococcus lacustris]
LGFRETSPIKDCSPSSQDYLLSLFTIISAWPGQNVSVTCRYTSRRALARLLLGSQGASGGPLRRHLLQASGSSSITVDPDCQPRIVMRMTVTGGPDTDPASMEPIIIRGAQVLAGTCILASSFTTEVRVIASADNTSCSSVTLQAAAALGGSAAVNSCGEALVPVAWLPTAPSGPVTYVE